MKLLVVRHGQTDFNVSGRPQGQEIDAPLNAEGIRQVEEAAAKVPRDVDVVIVSPLKRAVQSAGILTKELAKEMLFDDRIKEMKYGALAGKTWLEIAQLTGLSFDELKRRDDAIEFDYSAFGGDTGETFKSRVRSFVDDVREKYPDKNILVVAHGGVIDVLHTLYPQNEREVTGNASIHEFDL